jgi:hypothetical protein
MPKDFKIIWLSNLFTLNVLDEGCSRNAPCALNTDFTEEQQTLESDKNNDNNNTMPQSFVDIHDIGVNVPPPHHKTKNSKIPRVPSKVCLPYLTLIFTSFFSLLVVDLCIVYKYVDI